MTVGASLAHVRVVFDHTSNCKEQQS